MLLASIHKLSNNPYINAQAQIVVNDCTSMDYNQYINNCTPVRVDKAVFRNLVALGACWINDFLGYDILENKLIRFGLTE